MTGLWRLLSARCVLTILDSLENLHKCEELTLSSLNIQSIGLDADKQTGYLTQFCLDHEGSEAMTTGLPYYRRERQCVAVADAFQAAAVSSIYFLAPHVWIELFEQQEVLPEDDRLSPMGFIKEVVN